MTDDASAPSAPASYSDDDLVYVDPQAKTVVGRVEFAANGKPKKMPLPSGAADAADAEEPEEPANDKKGRRVRRSPRVRYCPWGTYRSMKRVYKLEGKPPRVESNKTLDEVLEKALQEPFWD